MQLMAIGKKVGMTRIFNQNGKAIAITVVKVEPNTVVLVKDLKEIKKVQIAAICGKHISKPLAGHLKKVTEDKMQVVREFSADADAKFKAGDKITVKDFEEGDVVSACGTSKGKGFAGVIKRHNFHRGPESHGSDHHRKPGSIGSMFPQHVYKGQKMPGHMGAERVTVKNLQVQAIDVKENLLLVSGAIPGNRNSVVFISK